MIILNESFRRVRSRGATVGGPIDQNIRYGQVVPVELESSRLKMFTSNPAEGLVEGATFFPVVTGSTSPLDLLNSFRTWAKLTGQPFANDYDNATTLSDIDIDDLITWQESVTEAVPQVIEIEITSISEVTFGSVIGIEIAGVFISVTEGVDFELTNDPVLDEARILNALLTAGNSHPLLSELTFSILNGKLVVTGNETSSFTIGTSVGIEIDSQTTTEFQSIPSLISGNFSLFASATTENVLNRSPNISIGITTSAEGKDIVRQRYPESNFGITTNVDYFLAFQHEKIATTDIELSALLNALELSWTTDVNWENLTQNWDDASETQLIFQLHSKNANTGISLNAVSSYEVISFGAWDVTNKNWENTDNLWEVYTSGTITDTADASITISAAASTIIDTVHSRSASSNISISASSSSDSDTIYSRSASSNISISALSSSDTIYLRSASSNISISALSSSDTDTIFTRSCSATIDIGATSTQTIILGWGTSTIPWSNYTTNWEAN